MPVAENYGIVNDKLQICLRFCPNLGLQLDSMTIFYTFLLITLRKSFCKKKILHIFAESKGNS